MTKLRIWVLASLLWIPGAGAAETAAPQFKKVLYFVFENADYETALKQPYFREFARRGALLQGMRAETHPSQPNYIAMMSGATHGVQGDSVVTVDTTHLGDLLERKGLSWKVYAEGYPGDCFLKARHHKYARKHVPFLSFRDVQTDPARCSRVVGGERFLYDFEAGALPDFSLFVPDLNHDGHDTSAKVASEYFRRIFDPLFSGDSPSMRDLLVVVTFDEGETHQDGDRIYTALYGDSVIPGAVVTQTYDHYSILRTIEDTLGLGNLGRGDERASAITGVWK